MERADSEITVGRPERNRTRPVGIHYPASDEIERDSVGASRTWRITEVVIGSNSGCPNSRCIPRPMNPDLIMDPPHVDPWIVTGVGSGQKTGCPEMRALPKP